MREHWKRLTNPQQWVLLQLLGSDPNPWDAGREFIAARSLVRKDLASKHWVHNQFKLTPAGRQLAEFGREFQARETTEDRQKRLYDEAMAKQKSNKDELSL